MSVVTKLKSKRFFLMSWLGIWGRNAEKSIGETNF